MNDIFYNTAKVISAFVNIDDIKNELESIKEKRLLLCESQEESDSTEETFKGYLTLVYRIRNNLAGLLLKNGFEAYRGDEDSLFLVIFERDYELSEKAIRNVLKKDFNNLRFRDKNDILNPESEQPKPEQTEDIEDSSNKMHNNPGESFFENRPEDYEENTKKPEIDIKFMETPIDKKEETATVSEEQLSNESEIEDKPDIILHDDELKEESDKDPDVDKSMVQLLLEEAERSEKLKSVTEEPERKEETKQEEKESQGIGEDPVGFFYSFANENTENTQTEEPYQETDKEEEISETEISDNKEQDVSEETESVTEPKSLKDLIFDLNHSSVEESKEDEASADSLFINSNDIELNDTEDDEELEDPGSIFLDDESDDNNSEFFESKDESENDPNGDNEKDNFDINKFFMSFGSEDEDKEEEEALKNYIFNDMDIEESNEDKESEEVAVEAAAEEPKILEEEEALTEEGEAILNSIKEDENKKAKAEVEEEDDGFFDISPKETTKAPEPLIPEVKEKPQSTDIFDIDEGDPNKANSAPKNSESMNLDGFDFQSSFFLGKDKPTVVEEEKPKSEFTSEAMNTDILMEKLSEKKKAYDKNLLYHKSNEYIPMGSDSMVFDLSKGTIKKDILDSDKEIANTNKAAENSVKVAVNDQMMDASIMNGSNKNYTFEMQKTSDYKRYRRKMLLNKYALSIKVYEETEDTDNGSNIVNEDDINKKNHVNGDDKKDKKKYRLVKKDLVNLIVCPIRFKRNNNDMWAEICAYLNNGREEVANVIQPNGENTLVMKCKEYAIIIKGFWEGSKFMTKLSVCGNGYKISASVIEKNIVPDTMEGTGIGHNVLYLDHATMAHIIPIEFENTIADPVQNKAPCFAVIEKDFGTEQDRYCITQKDDSVITVSGERYVFNLDPYWDKSGALNINTLK